MTSGRKFLLVTAVVAEIAGCGSVEANDGYSCKTNFQQSALNLNENYYTDLICLILPILMVIIVIGMVILFLGRSFRRFAAQSFCLWSRP